MARLTVKGIQPGMPFGGMPELTRTDIAAACTGLEPLHFHLIMAKYCDDVHSALKALGEVQDEMCERRSLWAEMDPIVRTKVAAALLEEFVSARRCRRCKGTGEGVEWKKVVPCKSCDGTGRMAVSAASRARACGIPESTFRSWGMMSPFQDMMDRLLDIEISALERVSRKAS